MTISVTGVTVDTGAPAQVARPLPNITVSAAGVNDQATVARQQMASAVPAPALIAAFSANIQPQPKVTPRPLSSSPSSSLAAQFIAQDDGITSEDLAIFEIPKPVAQSATQESSADDYLKDLRIARGDFSEVKKPAAAAANTQAEAVKLQQAANDNTLRNNIMQFTAALPAVLSQFMKRPTLLQAKGVVAYQLAEARNAGTRAAMAKEVAEAN